MPRSPCCGSATPDGWARCSRSSTRSCFPPARWFGAVRHWGVWHRACCLRPPPSELAADFLQLVVLWKRLGRLQRGRLLLPGAPAASRQNATCQHLTRRGQRREFCFTLENDVFVRYQSFKDSAELRAALVKRCGPRTCPMQALCLTEPCAGALPRLILGPCSTWTRKSAPPTPPWARTASLRPQSASSSSTW
jgi:hypothetical protein